MYKTNTEAAEPNWHACPHCGSILSITKAGKLYRHGSVQTGLARATCPGSGLKVR